MRCTASSPDLARRERLLRVRRVLVLREDHDAPSWLRLPRRAGSHGRRRPRRDVGADLGHAERLEHLGPGCGGPLLGERRQQRLPGAEAVAQRGKIELLGRPVLEQLAVDGGDGGEDVDAVLGDQPRPDRGVRRAAVEHRVSAHRPDVHQPHAERVGPVQRAGVQRDVAGLEAFPRAPHQRAPVEGALRVQHPLGTRLRARGVDQKGRVLGLRLRQLAVAVEAVEVGGVDADALEGGQGQVGGGDGGARLGVGAEERGLGGRELRRGGDRRQPGGVRAEEGEGVVGRVRRAHQHAVAGLESAREQPAPDALHAFPRLGVGPALRAIAVEEAERRPVRKGGVACPHLEAGAGDVERPADRGLHDGSGRDHAARPGHPVRHGASSTSADIEPCEVGMRGSAP